MRYLAIGLCAFTVACSGTTPTAPSFDVATGSGLAASAGATASAASPVPHFNLQAILRGDGFGLLALRQEKDPTQDILFMDVWVRDLLPNTSYDLQRAVDAPQDGICTGTNRLTMGRERHRSRFSPTKRAPAAPSCGVRCPPTASASDIHFRVVPTGTSTTVLHSDCFRLLRRE